MTVALFFPYLGFVQLGLPKKVFNEATSSYQRIIYQANDLKISQVHISDVLASRRFSRTTCWTTFWSTARNEAKQGNLPYCTLGRTSKLHMETSRISGPHNTCTTRTLVHLTTQEPEELLLAIYGAERDQFPTTLSFFVCALMWESWDPPVHSKTSQLPLQVDKIQGPPHSPYLDIFYN